MRESTRDMARESRGRSESRGRGESRGSSASNASVGEERDPSSGQEQYIEYTQHRANRLLQPRPDSAPNYYAPAPTVPTPASHSAASHHQPPLTLGGGVARPVPNVEIIGGAFGMSPIGMSGTGTGTGTGLSDSVYPSVLSRQGTKSSLGVGSSNSPSTKPLLTKVSPLIPHYGPLPMSKTSKSKQHRNTHPPNIIIAQSMDRERQVYTLYTHYTHYTHYATLYHIIHTIHTIHTIPPGISRVDREATRR